MRGPLELKRGEMVLGTLRPYDMDDPWLLCKFEPTAAFAEIAPLFLQELAVIQDADNTKWINAYSEIEQLGLRLVPVDNGEEISEFLLHIDDNEAWFRY